jgi:hypothetical protein
MFDLSVVPYECAARSAAVAKFVKKTSQYSPRKKEFVRVTVTIHTFFIANLRSTAEQKI